MVGRVSVSFVLEWAGGSQMNWFELVYERTDIQTYNLTSGKMQGCTNLKKLPVVDTCHLSQKKLIQWYLKSGPIPFNYFLESLHNHWNTINHHARNYLFTEQNAIITWIARPLLNSLAEISIFQPGQLYCKIVDKSISFLIWNWISFRVFNNWKQ